MSISNLNDINNGIDIACNSITTLMPLPGGGDVVGPSVSKNGYIATYDGVSGKIIKSDANIGATGNRLQAFDGFGLPDVLEINGDLSMLGSDIGSVGNIGSNSVSTDLISSFAGSEVVFNNKPQSATLPSVDADLTNKLYVDTAISGVSGGDVSGPVSAKNGYLTTYDGITGKLIKSDSTVASTNNRIEAFDAFGLANTLEINSDTDHLGSDITNVGTIGCDSINTDIIASKSGSTVSFNNKPQSSIAPIVDNDLTNRLYVESRLGYLYAMVADGPTVSNGDPESSLLPSGAGTSTGSLTVGANEFSVGDSFHFVIAGNCIYDTNNDITLRLKNGGILAEITMDLEDTDAPNTYFELEADFSIRSIGVSGSIVTNFDFTFNKKVDKDFKGQRNVTVSTIDTTVSNTLDITAQFTGSDTSSMFARLGYLKKMH